jgi:hypothetical protein
MKNWLAFLFLLVSSTASFYPCCSEIDCCTDELTSTNARQDQHPSESNCSPFVACGTCPGFTQTATVVDIPVVQKEKPEHLCKAISLLLSSYMPSLLQPPRVA